MCREIIWAVTQNYPSWWLTEILWRIAAAWIFNLELTPSLLAGDSLHFWYAREEPLPPLLRVTKFQQVVIAKKKKIQKKENFC